MEMAETLYRVKVENIFEGPMDLLIHLIRKNEVDIYDIPIALITHQYLAYVEWIKLIDIDNVGDFIMMAATLMQIKSRTLLPTHGNEDEDEEDPRLEITRPLLEYIKFKSVAEELAGRSLLGIDTFIRKPDKDEIPQNHDSEMLNVGLFELIDAFQGIIKRLSGQHRVDLTTDRISIKDRITQLVDILEKKGSVTFDELCKSRLQPNKGDIIVTLLAILEMAKLNLIRFAQHIQSGIIRIFYL
jgi:segregation and condensation protein A